MKLVVDTNIVFSVIIKSGKTGELLMHKMLDLYAPEFMLDELSNYIQYLSEKTHRNISDVLYLLSIFMKQIKVIKKKEYNSLVKKVTKYCPDPNDNDFFALALKLACPIWSNDKQLGQQSFIPIFATHALLEMLPEETL